MNILLNCFYCFMATLFFSYIMVSPKKVIFVTSTVSTIGYFLYELCITSKHSVFVAFFISIFFIASLGETLSLLLKTPSIVIIFPAIIPFVPGIGLYQTILSFIQKDTNGVVKFGYETIITSIIIAATVAIVTSIFNLIKTQVNFTFKNKLS